MSILKKLFSNGYQNIDNARQNGAYVYKDKVSVHFFIFLNKGMAAYFGQLRSPSKLSSVEIIFEINNIVSDAANGKLQAVKNYLNDTTVSLRFGRTDRVINMTCKLTKSGILEITNSNQTNNYQFVEFRDFNSWQAFLSK